MNNDAPKSFVPVQIALMRRQPYRYAAALVLWTGIWTLPVIIGLITSRFFDALASGVTASAITALVVGVFMYAVVRTIIIFLGMRNHSVLLFNASQMLRRNLMVRIYELPGADGPDETPGELVSRFRDDVEHIVQPFDLSVDLFGASLGGAISVAIMWSIDPSTTLVVAIPVVIVGIVANRVGDLVRRFREQARETTETMTGFLGETFSAAQSVKVAGAEPHILRRFRSLNDERRSAMLRDRTLSAVLEAVYRNTVNIGTGLILLLAAGKLGAGGPSTITIGEFALFVFLLTLVTESAYFYGMQLALTKQATVSVVRLTETLAGESWRRLVEGSPSTHGSAAEPDASRSEATDSFESLSVRGLSFEYNATGKGIQEVDLDIKKGEFVVVTGRIGSGKTTLMRTILGLLHKDSGSIVWNGTEVEDPSAWFVPPRSAYTPQVPKLFSMSLEDNLVLGADLDDGELAESIHIATMQRDIDQMPEGLGTQIGPRGVRLSGGQVQRSAAARMFARLPQLLVLDDVSSALDVHTEQLLWKRLFEARSDVAALVVSHRHSALVRADRVIVMENGRVVAVGTASELAKTSETFRSIWDGAQKNATNG